MKKTFLISNFPICHQTELKIGGKCSFGFCRESHASDTDTESQPWFRFSKPIPNFCRTLVRSLFRMHWSGWMTIIVMNVHAVPYCTSQWKCCRSVEKLRSSCRHLLSCLVVSFVVFLIIQMQLSVSQLRYCCLMLTEGGQSQCIY